jgi:hypothetical protein
MSAIRRDPVTLFGRRGQAAAETAREFLERNRVPLRWVDLDLDPLARLLSDREIEAAVQPVALFADGSRLGRRSGTPSRRRGDVIRPARAIIWHRSCGGPSWRPAPASLCGPSTTTTT